MYTGKYGNSKNGPSVRLNAELSDRNGPAGTKRGLNQKQDLEEQMPPARRHGEGRRLQQ